MNAPAHSSAYGNTPRQLLQQAVAQLDHVLPGQAPILNFVHHNTLHGFQHLPFAAALQAAEKINGIYGYQSEMDFRRYYAQGRIQAADLHAAISAHPELQADQILLQTAERTIYRRDVFNIALLYGIEPLTPAQLDWQLQAGALNAWQADLPAAQRQILQNDQPQDLWLACLDALKKLTDLSLSQAKAVASRFASNKTSNALQDLQAYKQAVLTNTLDDIGINRSLRDLLQMLTGQDILEHVRPVLIRYLGAYLDEGLAAWPLAERSAGFYAAWRCLASNDPLWLLAELPNWREQLLALPDDATDAVALLLNTLQIPPDRWAGYLQRIALEIPGWSGMVNWRQQRPGYAANHHTPVALMDYLALRLFLDQLWLTRLCRDTWRIDAGLEALRHYFSANQAEFLVRSALQRGDLSEHLAAKAQLLVADQHSDRHAWRELAQTLWHWQHSPAAKQNHQHSASHDAWRLFRLAQHLGLGADPIRRLNADAVQALLETLDGFDRHTRGNLWLSAYERRYREQMFHALHHNRQRGCWSRQPARPEAQVIFCMDDREESFRRHLEELNPQIETLGAAGFFGVVMNWRGLDDSTVTPLCPVVAVPSHEIREIPQPGAASAMQQHIQRHKLQKRLQRLLHQELRRNLLSSSLLLLGLAPLTLLVLLGKVLAPSLTASLVERARRWLSPEVPTELALTAQDDGSPTTPNAVDLSDAEPSPSGRGQGEGCLKSPHPNLFKEALVIPTSSAAFPEGEGTQRLKSTALIATPEHNRLGFTDTEQAERAAGFLRTVGLTSGFSPLVVIAGHGSASQNNPHMAAYDCGACSGRHGGPNARAFAALANRPAVRRLLAEQGIAIPDDTWFIGTEHNTANEDILWFDLDRLPAGHKPAQAKLKQELDRARQLSAHERCRRLMSAPRRPTLSSALRHIRGRSVDFSQARPELGHATNAAAFIGRRSMSRGVFFDRRVFLISYDPTLDAEGKILENILLNAGPVGAGISLEYYFSTVNNERFGCGSKTPHNVTGWFGVMEGTSSDLRTGLPRQMVEIHEAMRLLVVTEHKPEVLVAIYQRQAPIRELVGNAWIQLATLDPDSGEIFVFDARQENFAPWQAAPQTMPQVPRSTDWYAGHSEPLPPVLITKN